MLKIRHALLLVCCLALGSCGSWFQVKCAKPADYAGVIDNPPLKIPEGRDPADTRAALTIPVLDAPEAPRPADSPCIDTPPVFTPAAPKKTEG